MLTSRVMWCNNKEMLPNFGEMVACALQLVTWNPLVEGWETCSEATFMHDMFAVRFAAHCPPVLFLERFSWTMIVLYCNTVFCLWTGQYTTLKTRSRPFTFLRFWTPPHLYCSLDQGNFPCGNEFRWTSSKFNASASTFGCDPNMQVPVTFQREVAQWSCAQLLLCILFARMHMSSFPRCCHPNTEYKIIKFTHIPFVLWGGYQKRR